MEETKNTEHISAPGFHISNADTSNLHTPSLADWSFKPTNDWGVVNVPTPESPQLDRFVNAFKVNTQKQQYMSQQGIDKWSEYLRARGDTSYGKMDLTDYVNTRDAYTKLSDGSYLKNYDFYNKDIDNESRAARFQTDTERFLNPVKRTIKNAALGLGDFFDNGWSILKGVFHEEASMIHDRSALTNWLDDQKAIHDNYYRNYYSEAARNAGIGLNLKTWDEFNSGAEFTARMLVSEVPVALLTGGGSIGASLAKAGMRLGAKLSLRGATKLAANGVIKGIGGTISSGVNRATRAFRTTSSMVGATHQAGASTINALGRVGAKIGNNLDNITYGMRTAHAEARFETRHFQDQALQDYLDYGLKNGFDTKGIEDFNKRLSSASNAIYATNMAVLGLSNLMIFRNLNPVKFLAKPLSFATKPIAAKLFGEGVKKTAEGTFKGLTPNIGQKIAKFGAASSKDLVTESLFEEGLQGTASKAASAYVQQAYDPDSLKELRDLTDFVSYGFDQTYKTEEGQHELAIAMLVGGFLGGIGNAKSFGGRQKQRNEMEAGLYNDTQSFVNNYINDSYTKESMLRSFGSVSRAISNIREAEAHKSKGDDLGEITSQHKAMFSLMERAKQLGKEDYVAQNFIDGLNKMDLKEYAEFNGISVEEAKDHRDSKIAEFKQIQKTYNDAYEVGEAIFGKGNIRGLDKEKTNPQELVNAYAYLAATAESNKRFAKNAYDVLQAKLAGKVTNESLKGLSAYAILNNASEAERRALLDAETEVKAKQEEVDNLKKEIEKHSLEQNGEGRSPEAKEKANKVIHELSQKLTDAQTNLSHIKARAESLRDVAIRNFQDRLENNAVTMDAYTSFIDKMEDFKNAADNLNLSVREKAEFDTLFDYFDRANQQYHDYLSITLDMMDPKVQLKTFEGMFPGLINGKWRGISEETRNALGRLYGVVENTREARLDSDEYFNELTDDEKEAFKNRERWDGITDSKLDPYFVPEEIDIRRVAKKVFQGKSLTRNEEIFYNNFRDEIDQKIEDLYGDPINSTDEDTLLSEVAKKVEQIDEKLKEISEKRKQVEENNHPELQAIDNEIKELRDKRDALRSELDTLTSKEIIRISEVIEQEAATEIDTINNSNLSDAKKQEAIAKVKSEASIKINKLFNDYLNNRSIEVVRRNGTIQELPVTRRRRQKRIKAIDSEVAKISATLDKHASEIETLLPDAENRSDRLNEAINERRAFVMETKHPVKGTPQKNIFIYEKSGDKLLFFRVNAKTGSLVSVKKQDTVDELSTVAKEKTILATDDLLAEKDALENKPRFKQIDTQIDKLDEISKQLADLVEATHNATVKRFDRQQELLAELDSEKENLEKEQGGLKEIPNIKEDKDRVKRQVIEADKEVADTFNKAIEDQKQNGGVRNQDLFDAYYQALSWRKHLLSKLSAYEKEWANQKRKQPYNPEAPIAEQVEWVVDNLNNIGITTKDELEELAKIPESDIKRYKELSEKISNLTSDEEVELEELTKKLNNYFLLDNAGVSEDFKDFSILDLVRLSLQSQKQSQVPLDEEFNLKEHVKAVEKEFKHGFSSKSTGKVYWGAHVATKPGGRTQYYHVKVGTIIEAANKVNAEVVVEIDGKEVPVNPTLYPLLEMTSKPYRVIINDGVSPIIITREKNSFDLIVHENEFFTVAELLGAQPIQVEGRKPGFSPLYIKDAQGNLSVRPSDVVVELGENAERTIEFDYDALDNIEPDEEVYLRFEPAATYNIHLEKNSSGSIEDDFVEKGVILIENKEGKLLNVLPAMNRAKKAQQSQLAVYRQKAVEAAKNAERVPIKIDGFYEGIPNITFNQDMQPIWHTVKDSQVIDYGYMKDGAVVSRNNETFSTRYVKDNQPFVVLKQGTTNIAVPVQLTQPIISTNSQLQDLYNNNRLSDSEKALRMNEVLISAGVLTKETMFSPRNISDRGRTENIIQEVQNALAKVDFTNLDNFKGATKSTYIDPNKPLSPRKLKFNFGIKTGRPSKKELSPKKVNNEALNENIYNNLC